MCRNNVILLAIVLLALLLRLTAFFIEPYELLYADAGNYVAFAEDLAAGKDYTAGDDQRVIPRSMLPPLYPLFLAAFFVTTGFVPKLIILVQIVLSLVVVLATYFLSRQFVSERFSLVAALFVAICPALAGMANRLLTEALYIPLLAVMAALYCLATNRCSLRYALLAGLTCGAVMLTRNAALLLPVALVAGLLFVNPDRRGVRLVLVLLLGVTVSLCPWWIHKHSRDEKSRPAQVSQGTSILTAYALAAHHGFMVRPNRVPFAYDDPDRATEEYMEKVWKPLHTPGYTPPVTARYFLSHPMDYLRQTWWRFFQCVKPESQGAEAFGFPDSFGEYFRGRRFDVLILKGIILAFSAILIFGAFAGGLLATRSFRTFVPLYAIAGYFLCVHVFVHMAVRYRYALIPLLAVFAAFFFCQLWQWSRNRGESPPKLQTDAGPRVNS